MGQEIRLLLSRTPELWWDGLLKLLEGVPDMRVVAVCANASQTLKLAAELRPDVVLLDEEVSEGECGAVARDINALDQNTQLVIVIKPYKQVKLASTFKARARAYVDKDITFEEFTTAVRCVAKGGLVVISREVAKTMLENLESLGQNQENVRPEYNVGLSRRETEVLGLLARSAKSNKEIAESLFITESTVKAHLSSILEKMKVRNRQEAAAMARKVGLGQEPERARA